MSRIWVFDVEADSLTPTRLHCASLSNPKTEKIISTTDYDQMRKAFTSADVLIGHNIQRFDAPVLERLLGIKIKAKLIDTLALSWYCFPNRLRHGIESWGITFGIQKPWIADWESLTPEEYIHRCEEDVKITLKLWKIIYQYLWDIYGSDKAVWEFLDYITFKMHCAVLQEKAGWKVDVPWVKENLEKLEAEKEIKVSALSRAMPQIEKFTTKNRPKVFLTKDGSFSKHGLAWIELCSKNGLPPDYDGEIKVSTGFDEGNPSSHAQVKDWLFSLGWKPRTFKETKDKEDNIKQIPQINADQGKGICDSIKELYDKEPSLELLDGLSVLSHRISILKGFLRDVDENGYVKAQISGFTNTLRCQHTTVVNLPKVDTAHGGIIRGSLIASKGNELCGSDMASLEDRLKQHYIYVHDPEYVKTMLQDDYDAHLTIAELAGMLTKEQVAAYRAGDKSYGPIRHLAKTVNYSSQYGAGPPKIARSSGMSIEDATKLHKTYWELNHAVKKVAADQVVKTLYDPTTGEEQMWLLNPVSKFWYSLRYMKDIFSTLVQGTASYVFDRWIQIIFERREQLTAQFHDEIVLEIKEGNQEACKKLLTDAMVKLNKELKLNRELAVSVQFGSRYSSIH